MNEQQTERLLSLLGSIADSLGRLAGQQDGDNAPDAVWPIEEYASFDWAALGAQVIARDADGPTVVMWGGKNFKRRAPDNAFDPAIWFSHCIGKDAEGRNEYQRLVTFKKFREDDVQPLGRKAERYVERGNGGAVERPAPPAGAPQPQSAAPTVTSPITAPEADRMFGDLPSASANLPPPEAPKPTNGAPKISAGARPHTDPNTCATCGKPWTYENAACPAHRAPSIPAQLHEPAAAPANGGGSKRQATLDVGAVGGEFRNWAAEFAKRHPQYRLNSKSEEADMYHIMKTIGGWDIARVERANLAEVCARLEAHAAANGA